MNEKTITDFTRVVEQYVSHMEPAACRSGWHGAGFRCYWRWKARPLGGRPQIDTELRALIRRMSVENPLWGARHAFTANCSSSGLRSRRRASPSTWSSDAGHPARDGGPSCVTTRQTLPPWTCSLFQPSVSTCSMPSSSSGFERLGPDDRKDLQDGWNPPIQLDKEPAIMVGEPDATMQPAPQDN
jgi:hypothetical protein